MEKRGTTGNVSGAIKKKNLKRLSRFVFTLNNYTTISEGIVKEAAEKLRASWMIYGRETASTGTPHLQGACVIGRQVAFNTIKNVMPQGTHIEPMNGTPEQSLSYCSKEDPNPWQYGTVPNPGKRNDLISLVEHIKPSVSIGSVVEKCPEFAATFVRYHRGILALKQLRTGGRDPDNPPKVYWLYGESGAGKTSSAFKFLERLYGRSGIWMSGSNLKWFDGYDGHLGVILDDLRRESVPYQYLLRLLDRYPIRVETKGGTVEWVPEHIIITAPYSAEEIFFGNYRDDTSQLLRRITKQVECFAGQPISFGEEHEQHHEQQQQEEGPSIGGPKSETMCDMSEEEFFLMQPQRGGRCLIDLTKDDDDDSKDKDIDTTVSYHSDGDLYN
jgi:hypothetical protein